MLRYLTVLSLGLATLTVGADPAVGQQSGEPVYYYVFFDDAAHTNIIGTMRGKCSYYGVDYDLTGNQSPYYNETLAYYCDPYAEPIEGY